MFFFHLLVKNLTSVLLERNQYAPLFLKQNFGAGKSSLTHELPIVAFLLSASGCQKNRRVTV